jgi:hypothetical protein
MSDLTALLADLEASKARTESAISTVKAMLAAQGRAQAVSALAEGDRNDLNWKNSAGKLTAVGVAYLEKRASEGATAYALCKEMSISYASAERRVARFKLAQHGVA